MVIVCRKSSLIEKRNGRHKEVFRTKHLIVSHKVKAIVGARGREPVGASDGSSHFSFGEMSEYQTIMLS
jgi:hypothetical protein